MDTKSLDGDFNPRPREEGDSPLYGCDTAINKISIHALVKRATVAAVDGVIGHDISIHALVKRATNITR